MYRFKKNAASDLPQFYQYEDAAAKGHPIIYRMNTPYLIYSLDLQFKPGDFQTLAHLKYRPMAHKEVKDAEVQPEPNEISEPDIFVEFPIEEGGKVNIEHHVKQVEKSATRNDLQKNMVDLFESIMQIYDNADVKFRDTTKPIGTNTRFLTTLDDAQYGFVYGALLSNFKNKLNLQMSFSNTFLYMLAKLRPKYKPFADPVPLLVKLAPLQTSDNTHNAEDHVRRVGMVLPVMLDTYADKGLAFTLNFHGDNAIAVKSDEVPVVTSKGFLVTALEEFNEYHQQNAQYTNMPNYKEWSRLRAYAIKKKLASAATKEVFKLLPVRYTQQHFLSSLYLGQLLALKNVPPNSAAVHSDESDLEKFYYQKFVFSPEYRKFITTTSFVVKIKGTTSGIQFNIIETTTPIENFDQKVDFWMPHAKRCGLTEIMQVDIHAHKFADPYPGQFPMYLDRMSISDLAVSEIIKVTPFGKGPSLPDKPLPLAQPENPYTKLNDVKLGRLFRKNDFIRKDITVLKNSLESALIMVKDHINSPHALNALVAGMLSHDAKVIEAPQVSMQAQPTSLSTTFAYLPFSDKWNTISQMPLVVNTDFISAGENRPVNHKNGLRKITDHTMNDNRLNKRAMRNKRLNVILSKKTKNSGTTSDVHLDIHENDIFHDFYTIPSTSHLDACLRPRIKRSSDRTCFIEMDEEKMSKVKSHVKISNMFKYMYTVGRFSSIGTSAMMAKNVIAELANSDYKGVAINLGFISAGIGLSQLGNHMHFKASLLSEQKLMLKNALKTMAPFISRATSAFIVYDLVKNVMSYQSNDTDLLVNIVADSIYLTTDVIDIGVALLEAFSIIEGVSSFAGPIGMAIGLMTFIGTDVYFAAKAIREINKIVHIHPDEKLLEGIRLFLGMKPDSYIADYMDQKRANSEIYKGALYFLKQNSLIGRYVTPTGKIVEACESDTKRGEACGSFKILLDANNTVILNKQVASKLISRSIPDETDDGQLFCLEHYNSCGRRPKAILYLAMIQFFSFAFPSILFSHTDESWCADIDKHFTYKYQCINAFGVEPRSSETVQNKTTFINLEHGFDIAIGSKRMKSIFSMGHGQKYAIGGKQDDVFLLQSHPVTGLINGRSGNNTLDLTKFHCENCLTEINLESDSFRVHTDQNSDYFQSSLNHVTNVTVRHITKVIGRQDEKDIIIANCKTAYLNGNGGKTGLFNDIIKIPSKSCMFNMQIKLKSAFVYNFALKGTFNYMITDLNNDSSSVKLCNESSANHVFNFKYALYNLNLLKTRGTNTIKLKIIDKIEDQFVKLFVHNVTNRTVLAFMLDGTQVMKSGMNFVALQNTTKSVADVILLYQSIVDKLGLTLVSYSQCDNATVTIVQSKFSHLNGHQHYGSHVLYNDNTHESHLVGGNSENVYVIDANSQMDKLVIPNVTIYCHPLSNHTDTIDLNSLSAKIRRATKSDNSSMWLNVEIEVPSDNITDQIVLYLYAMNSTGEKGWKITNVLVKNIQQDLIYTKLNIYINQVHMKINGSFSLVPLPLKFSNENNIIVLSDNDITFGNEIFINRSIDFYNYTKLVDDLILTNTFNESIADINHVTTIVLQNFYNSAKMTSLSLKFLDKQIRMNEELDEIHKASEYVSLLDQYYDHYWDSRNEIMDQWESSQPLRDYHATMAVGSMVQKIVSQTNMDKPFV